MFGAVIRHLIDEKLTSIAEVEALTGRGTSTVYRWMNDESQPHYDDMRTLVRGLARPEARRTLLDQLTSDLPVVINWIDEDDTLLARDEDGRHHDGHDVLQRTLLALDCITDALGREHDAIRERNLDSDTCTDLVEMMDRAIRYLTSSRVLLQAYAQRG